MTSTLQPVDEPMRPIAPAAEDAAAATMRRAGARMKAPATDIDTVLAALFGEVLS